MEVLFDAARGKSLVLISEGKGILRALDIDAPEFFQQVARVREILLLLDAQNEAARQFQAIEQRYAQELKNNAESGAPLPAPNGAPSNLNRQQWVLARTPNFKRWFGECEISEQVAEQVSTFVDDALAYRNPNPVKLWVVPDWQVREIKKLIGIDVSGYSFELVENDIRHAIGAHGDTKKEMKRKPSNEAITEADLKALPYILKNPDRIRAGTEKGGRQSVIFEKRVNGVITAVEVIATAENKLLNKTMWKRLSAEGGDAQSETAPANTSESAATPSLYQNIVDFLAKSKASKIIDGNGDPQVVYHGTSGDFAEFTGLSETELAISHSARFNPCCIGY